MGNTSEAIKRLIKYGIILLALFYIIFPIDILPEALLGPLGYIDDLVAAILIIIVGLGEEDIEKLFSIRKTTKKK